MPLMLRLAAVLERMNRLIGRGVAWLTVAMVVVTFGIVILRYLLDLGWIWLQESVTWMHAAVFMLAAAYTLATDEHVRVDIFYREATARQRAWIDAIGTLLFLLPFAGFLAWSSWDYVVASWQVREGSREAGGLAFPAMSLMKSFIPATAVMLFLQGLVIFARCLCTLRGVEPVAVATEEEHRGPV